MYMDQANLYFGRMPAVLLFRGRGLISALIRWQTRARYAHAAIRLPDGRVLEAWQGRGVRIKRLQDWDGVDAYTVPGVDAFQWREVIQFAVDQIGKPYDYLAIARFVTRRTMPDNARWFCSELVFESLRQAGVVLLNRVDAWQVSPGMLSTSPLLVRESISCR